MATEADPTEQALVQAKDWKGLERFYRQQLRTPASEEQEIRHWRALGETYRDRLEDYPSALVVYELLRKRTSAFDRDRIELAKLYERAKRYDDAISVYEEVLAAYPPHPETHGALFELHSLRKAIDASWRVAAAQVWFGMAKKPLEDFYADYAPRRVKPPARLPTAEEWEWAVHPNVATPLRGIFRIAQVAIEHTREVTGEGAKALVAAAPEFRLAHTHQATVTALLLAAMDEVGARRASFEDKPDLNAVAEQLQPALAAVDKAALRQAVQAFVDGGAKANVSAWQAGLMLSLERADLLFLGDPMRCTPKPEAATIAWFASTACGRLRAAVGLALAQSA